MGWPRRWRKRLRGLLRREAVERELDEELSFHLEQEIQKNLDRGLSSGEARRQAMIAFGGVERYKEQVREARALAWVSGLSLDFKLGARMLLKHPGLAVVGAAAMAVGIAIGATSFGVIRTLTNPSLPLDEGDRVLTIQNLSEENGGEQRNSHLHDLEVWRVELDAVRELGAYRTVDRNLVSPDGRIESVRVAEMTASGFRIARVPPLLGRYFVDDDERDGSAVVVIGYDVWQSRFAGDPDVVGRTLQLGATRHEVIGVMPDGFAFPIRNRVWAPLRLDPLDYEAGRAPWVEVFGRLAPDATLAEARAQASSIGTRLATVSPDTHLHLNTTVLHYSHALLELPQLVWGLYLVQLLISSILVVIGVNVAILVYARTATRMGEIAVRTALGASRARVVTQLFAEALVLSGLAALGGLAAARLALAQIDAFMAYAGEQVPFWWSFDLSLGTIAYTAGLAVLAAAIVGILPALTATGRQVQGVLKRLGPGQSIRLGGGWSALIVLQVVVAVSILPFGLVVVGVQIRGMIGGPAYVAADDVVTARLYLDRTSAFAAEPDPPRDEAFRARYAELTAELVRQLAAEPGVTDVVLASAPPGLNSEERVEVEPRPEDTQNDPVEAPYGVADIASVDDAFFGAFDVPILAGRVFHRGDFAQGSTAVVVNRAFVDDVLAGTNAVGRRARRLVRGSERDSAPWHEIVGVVEDFPGARGQEGDQPFIDDGTRARMYHPLIPGTTYPVTVIARAPGVEAPEYFERLRGSALTLDPMLRVTSTETLTQTLFERDRPLRVLRVVIVSLSLSTLLLSAAGISALLSFTVAMRRREIGIRLALGAKPRSVLTGVLARALRHIGIGVGVGLALLVLLLGSTKQLGPSGVVLLLAVVTTIVVVGTLAAVGPARRALRVHPIEVLKE
jgi:predicted permease